METSLKEIKMKDECDTTLVESSYDIIKLTKESADKLFYFFDESTNFLCVYGTGTMTDYSSTNQPWYKYLNQIKTLYIDYGVESLGVRSFYSFVNIENVRFSDTVKSIGERVFANCELIKTITFGKNFESIGPWAFDDCIGLQTVIIKSLNFKTVLQSAFDECTSLKSIKYIGSQPPECPSGASYDCDGCQFCDELNNCNVLSGIIVSVPSTYSDQKFCQLDVTKE